MTGLLDKEIFEWIRDVGAEDISVQGAGKASRDMAESIFSVHRCLYVLRKSKGSHCESAARALLLTLRKIQFACAMSHASDPRVFSSVQKICNHYERLYPTTADSHIGLSQLRQNIPTVISRQYPVGSD